MLKYLLKTSHSDVAQGLVAPVLPSTRFTQSLDLRSHAAHIHQYHHAFDWPKSLCDFLHPAYLAMYALQHQAPLILDRAQPFAALGLVHMSNTMRYTRLVKCDEILTIDFEFGTLWEQKRGWVFTVNTHVVDATNKVVLTLESHYLSRAKKRYHSDAIAQYAPHKIAIPDPDSVQYKRVKCDLSASLGRAYAKLSGDYNPIHLHPWLSRWFGFKQPIIHGMWSKARALSEIAQAWSIEVATQPIQITVQFTDFISLPNQVVLHQMSDAHRSIVLGLPENIPVTQPHRPYFVVEVLLSNTGGDNTVGTDVSSVSG